MWSSVPNFTQGVAVGEGLEVGDAAIDVGLASVGVALDAGLGDGSGAA